MVDEYDIISSVLLNIFPPEKEGKRLFSKSITEFTLLIVGWITTVSKNKINKNILLMKTDI